MKIIEGLQNLGLTEKEAKVYIALLQLGKATAYSVALRSNLKNSTTYVILENLIDKGIVKKIPRVKKTLFTAINPEDLFSIIKSKITNAEKEILPELKALNRGKEHKVKVSYYQGLRAIRRLYNEIAKKMKNKEFVAFFAHEKDASPELMKCFDEINEIYRKLKIKRRGITTYTPFIAERYLNDIYVKKYKSKIKALPPEKYNSNISIEVYKNYTLIFSHRFLQATLIDNPDIANVLKQIFELVWERDDIAVVSKE